MGEFGRVFLPVPMDRPHSQRHLSFLTYQRTGSWWWFFEKRYSQGNTLSKMRLHATFSIVVLLLHGIRWIQAFLPSAASLLPKGGSSFLQGRSSAASAAAATTTTTTSPPDHDELPADLPRRQDVLVALHAVRKAANVTTALQPDESHQSGSGSASSSAIGTVQKSDASPVTVADFAAQAIVLHHLEQNSILLGREDVLCVAEESSAALENDPDLAQQVMQASNMKNLEDLYHSINLGGEYETWTQPSGSHHHQQQPQSPGPPSSRVWCLDPIDGTKGFLRGKRQGGQYAIALALLEDGIPVIGILACPNLPAQNCPDSYEYAWQQEEQEKQDRGCIFVASKDGGCYQVPLVPNQFPTTRLRVTPNDGSTMSPSEGRFCIGVEKFRDELGQQCCVDMARALHGEDAIDEEGSIVNARRVDSQAKYGVLARGGAEYYGRIPPPCYVEWIWDHAAGKVVVEEAGGTLTDTEGRPIDFSLPGAKFSESVKGILVSNGGIFHEALLNAFREQEAIRKAKMAEM
jgi:HAL2 family 3'(2'),5'-bisphosphate nucleotidase